MDGADRPRTPSGGAPPDLAALQALFYDLVTAPSGVGPGLAARGLGPAALDSLVVGDERLSAIARLDVYANMYFYRILDVLRGEYPRVLSAVGEVAFHNLATEYLLAFRPAHPSLREVGARLPGFLAGHGVANERPWLAPLARLERAHRELFDGPDADALTMEALRGLAPEAFVAFPVALVPCHAVLEQAHALAPVWEPLGAGRVVVPAEAAETLLVWRERLAVRHRAIPDPAERAMLGAVAAGATLGSLCEVFVAAAAAEPGSAGAVTVDGAPVAAALAAGAFQVLARWVDDGLLVAAALASGPR